MQITGFYGKKPINFNRKTENTLIYISIIIPMYDYIQYFFPNT